MSFSKEQKQSFEDFVDGIDTSYWVDRLKDAMREAGLENSDIVYDFQELQAVEDFLLGVADGRLEVSDSVTEVKFWVSAYLGEVFIENFGGDWIQSDFPGPYNGYPAVLEGPGEAPYRPFPIVDSLLQEKKKGALVRNIERIRKRKELEKTYPTG